MVRLIVPYIQGLLSRCKVALRDRLTNLIRLDLELDLASRADYQAALRFLTHRF